ncbi:hypothetical protein HYR99_05890 [Candidatus Poribacteria bacterium]|nr:hypothetical protein [Candidatus Poribacteria bacterium]
MKEQLEHPLNQLKAEFESGQKMLADLKTRQRNLKETLLRISGAIQILEEALAQASQPTANASEPPEGAGQDTK